MPVFSCEGKDKAKQRDWNKMRRKPPKAKITQAILCSRGRVLGAMGGAGTRSKLRRMKAEEKSQYDKAISDTTEPYQ